MAKAFDKSRQSFLPFTSRLNRDFRDPDLRSTDLDGHGHPDVLITEEDGQARALRTFDNGPARLVSRFQSGFIHHRAPLDNAVRTSTVRGAVRRAFHRVGLSFTGTHVLHRTLATRLLDHGAPLRRPNQPDHATKHQQGDVGSVSATGTVGLR